MYRYLVAKNFSSNKNPFYRSAHKHLKVGENSFEYYNINNLGEDVSK